MVNSTNSIYNIFMKNRIISRIRHKLNDKVRVLINKKNQRQLNNHDFSLISSNCNGAFILHDLGMRFNSPFVNLYILPKDYIKMLRDLKRYMSLELVEVKENGISFPIGELEDIRIYFMHYSTFDEAKFKWNQRRERINYDNLFILFNDKDNCSEDDLRAFDSLLYKNKVVFTHLQHHEINSSVYISGFENETEVGNCYEYMPHSLGKKYYDQFDYVSWFNNT